MVLLDDVKPLKIYNRPMFLPTVESDKKKKSVVYLLTPNYESSKNLMNSDLLINKNRFQSYYIEKDLTYFISSKVMGKLEDVAETYVRNYTETDFYHSLCEMKYADRQKMKAKDFALPKQKKWPIHDKEHILDCIKYFNYVKREDEEELARNLNKAIDKHFGPGEWPNCGKKNRFKKYYKHAHEMSPITEVKSLSDIYLKYKDDQRDKMNRRVARSLNMLPQYKLYRYTYNGEGIYEALRKEVDKDTWIKILNSPNIKWLPKPPDEVYKSIENGYGSAKKGEIKRVESWFTVEGRNKFKEKTIPYISKYIDPSKIKEETTNLNKQENNHILHSDKYQMVIGYVDSSITEAGLLEFNFFKSTDNLEFNMDNLNSGRNKVLYITGYSGAGKSTTMNKIRDSYGNSVETVEFDILTVTLIRRAKKYWEDPDKVRNNPLIFEYLFEKGIDKGNFGFYKNFNDPNLISVYYDFCNWLETKSKATDFNNRIIAIEGTQIARMCDEDSNFFDDKPVIIIGTSAIISYARKQKRDVFSEDKWKKNPKKLLLLFKSMDIYTNMTRQLDKLVDSLSEATVYDPPLSYDKLPDHLKNDEVHAWRAKTGIELIHKEPTIEEMERIWNNWNAMTDEQKAISDKKSIELFGMDNCTHYWSLAKEYVPVNNPTGRRGINRANFQESVLNENIIVPTKDIEHDLDKWKVGKKNILFVTGLSGSGKSTKAAELSKANNAINIEIDLFEHNSILFDPKNVEQGEGNLIMKEYFEKRFGGKKKWKHYYYSENYGEELALFIHYMIEYAKTHADRLFVVEGIQILKLGGKIRDEVLECPIIIINTTLIKSIMQAIKRSGGLDGYFGKRGDWNIESFEDFRRWLNWYSDMEKNRANFIDTVKGLEEDTTLQKVGKALQNNSLAKPLTDFGKKSAKSKSGQFGLKIGQLIQKKKKEKEELDEGAYQIRTDGGFTDPDGIFNSIVTVDGSTKRLRGRGEMIILSQDRKKILLPIKNGVVKLPSGSFEKNERHMDTAIRETKEEIRVKVKDVFDPDINYVVLEPVHDWVREKIPEDKWWDGHYTEVFVGTYDGPFKGKVDEHDADPSQLKGTKWYDLDDTTLNSLRQEHRDAIEMYINRDIQEGWTQCDIPGFEDYEVPSINSDDTIFPDIDNEEIEGPATEDDITCTGYLEDLDVVRSLATKNIYNWILEEAGLIFDRIPHINIVATQNQTMDWYNINENSIEIYVDSNSEDRMSVEEFSNHVLRTMITSLIEYKYPNLSNTILPYSIAEYITFGNGELNSFLENYLSKKSYLDLYMETENLNSNELFKFVRSYGEGKIEYEEDLLTEKKALTADGLTRSLKYRGRAKLKKAHKSKNQTSDLIDKIKADIKPKGFQPPAGVSPTKPIKEDAIKYITNALTEGSYIESGEYLTILEDSTYDSNLKKILYTERMVKRKDAIALLDRAKADMPFIKYTFLEIDRYQQKNLFVDLYYYNQAFFKNNTFKDRKGFKIYQELLDRLINDKRIDKAGYTRKTVFIPINDWYINKDTKMWMFREDLNPISIIYELLMTDPNSLKKIFKNVTPVFFSEYGYFTVDFNDIKNSKVIANKLKSFIIKINKGEEFEPEDQDSVVAPSKKAIKADILDKIETSKGVDLTPATSDDKDTKEDIKKAAYSDDDFYYKDASYKKYYKDILDKIDIAVDGASDSEEALDNMDDDLDLKELIAGLDSNDDKVDINQARANRMSELDKELLDKSVHGRSIRDILKDDDKEEKEIPATKLEVASPNKEWEEMRYMNFDSTYDMEKDIINAFRHWSNVSRPLSIRAIKAENHSTSEDRLDLYTVEYEDYRGKRYTIKLDIPRIKRNRFLLRGNEKNIQMQFFNMPIVKTDLDTAQIVTNYKKIIISRYNTVAGRSLPNTSRLMKALDKYDGSNIKITRGFNERICNKYDLPIDYIDLASVYTKIETDKVIIYFNQDEIRDQYEIDESKGIPYGYYKKTKEVMYFDDKGTNMFVDVLIGLLVQDPQHNDNKFFELFSNAKPANRCTYTRARIMSSDIPLIIVCAYSEGLSKVLKKGNIKYSLVDKLTQDIRHDLSKDYIKFSDGYLVYEVTYDSSLLLNGFKECDTQSHSLGEIDDRNMYLEFLDNYGGRIKSDGLDNFYDCELDPITMENLERYKLPTDYISVLLYANYLLADNKYVNHTNMSSRRTRRYELIAAYTYQVMSEAYGTYANSLKHSRNQVPFTCKQSAVIDKIMSDTTFGDYSTNSILGDIEATNSLTFKGLSGMNSDRSYSLDKRVFDKSMVGVAGMSTGFSANVGITRQATLDASIEGNRGYVKDTKGKSVPNTAKMLTATEATVPMMSTHDDPTRVAMSFIQTAKHTMRTEVSDPLLVTNGADEALCYICSDEFVHKAKGKGTVTSLTDDDMIITYEDGSKEFVDLKLQIKKNSDGGFYEELKLDAEPKIKVGSKVKAGQIVAFDKYSISNSLGESDNYAMNIGKLAKVAIINTDEAFEDSGSIIESTARDLACRVIVKEECVLDKNTNIYNVVPVGTNVEQGDPLLIWQTPYEEEDVNALLKALANDTEAVNELGRHSIKSEYTGTVIGMKVYKTVEDKELSDSLRKLVKQYEKPINDLEKRLKQEGLEEEVDLPANYPLSATGKLKNAADGVKIEFYIEYLDLVGVGDKITYNAANKAVIAKVIPKGKEPYTDFRPNEPISGILSVTSIQKRMVQSIVTYGGLQKLMVELDRTCKDMADIPYDDSKV